MENVVIIILVFLAVMVITALVFGGWLIISVLKLIGRGIGALIGPRGARELPSPPHTVRCVFEKCRAVNPDRARFCRRCGKVLGAAGRHALPAPQSHVARRAAVA